MKEYSTRRALLVIWLCSAALVTGLRFLNPAELGYDLTLQIQAAQNLLAGKGLSFYRHEALDLAQPATLLTLTHFPAGFSLFAAALLAMGANVGMTVKVMGVAATILGWWGWAKLSSLFGKDVRRGRLWSWAALVIAVVTPLRFTPSWAGTDIVLWAAVPWVLGWTLRAADDGMPSPKWLDWAVGAVCGLCMLMRYASLFLVVYAACLMLWQSRMRMAVLSRRWMLFGLGLLPALVLQVYVNYVVSNAPARPGGLGTGEHGLGFVVRRAWEGFALLGVANYPWVFWLPGQAADFFARVDGAVPWRAGVVLAAFIAFVAWVRTHDHGPAVAAQDPRIVAFGLFVVLPLVLWGCMTLSAYDYVGDQRYYGPLAPLSVLLVLASTPVNRILRASGVLYLTGYIAIALIGIALLFVPGERGAMQRTRLIGTTSFQHWPSFDVSYEFFPARQFVRGLLKKYPDALLLTSKTQWFYADPAVDRARLLILSCTGLRARHLRGPAHVVVVTADQAGPPEALWEWAGEGRLERADCFEGLPGLRLLRRFPEDGVKILETQVPAGVEVVLAPRGRPSL